MAVTINDIAKAAGVSPSTVSRVISNNPRISSATREKVLKIMKEMDYHPNVIARSLVNKSTGIVAVLIPSNTEKAFQHPFYPEILRGITSAAYKNQYKILISGASDIKEEKAIIRDFTRNGLVEGIILLTSRVKDSAIAALKKIDFPFVVVGRPVNENEVNWVDNNNFDISYDLTSYLISQGHNKIAFIGVSSQYIVTLDRLEGYKKALQDNNIAFNENLIVEGKFMSDTGDNLIQRIFERGEKPTAIIACDDFLAFGAIKSLVEKGIKVPNDIAVAGFNNVPLCDYFTPSLTSVDVNAFDLGAKAFEMLMVYIKSQVKSFNRAIIPARLVIRNSTLRG